MTIENQAEAVRPLTELVEDERLFRDSVYEFADKEIRPLVHDMDEHAKIPHDLIEKLFDLGVMGIEIPETYGGAGASFFHAVLAVEELSRVDPSIGVLVDVQNTLVDQRAPALGHRRAEAAVTCRGWPTSTVGRLRAVGGRLGLRRLRAGDPRRRIGRPLHAERPQAVDHQRQRGRHLHRLRQP